MNVGKTSTSSSRFHVKYHQRQWYQITTSSDRNLRVRNYIELFHYSFSLFFLSFISTVLSWAFFLRNLDRPQLRPQWHSLTSRWHDNADRKFRESAAMSQSMQSNKSLTLFSNSLTQKKSLDFVQKKKFLRKVIPSDWTTDDGVAIVRYKMMMSCVGGARLVRNSVRRAHSSVKSFKKYYKNFFRCFFSDPLYYYKIRTLHQWIHWWIWSPFIHL